MRAVLLDSFSGSAAMLPRGRRTNRDILIALQRSPKVSCFDMSELKLLRDGIQDLIYCGKVVCRNDKCEYPWCMYEPLAEHGSKP